MALGDTLRRIVASDNFILNAAGALVGIKNPNANGLDLRVDQPAAYLPSILAQTGVPVILPSSGSSNASGQITLTTALPYQPVGTVQLYLPAGVVVGDAAGGLRSVTFSSTTVCQIVGAPATANAAYTQTTGADITLANVTVPGGSMGANGSLRTTSLWSMNSGASNKTLKQRVGGAAGTTSMVVAFTTNVSFQGQTNVRNRGATNQQIMFAPSALPFSASSGANTLTTVDTTADVAFPLQAQLAAATDFVILDAYLYEILPAA